MAEAKTARIIVNDKERDPPVLTPTVGPDCVDIRKLYGQADVFTFDPGFTSTASCASAITYIDGDKGELLYRGYPIEQLAEHGDFLETCYLMLFGALPTAAQRADFEYRVTRHTMVHEQLAAFFRGFRRDAHPMAVMVASVGALSAFYHDSTDITDETQRMIASIRMIAKMPTLGAWAFRNAQGKPYVYPDNRLSYVENFLAMLFKMSEAKFEADPRLVKALDVLFILHADHEQNCSTSTVRLVGSSEANLFTSVSGGINALWGPLHGGANQAVLEMLERIRADGGDAQSFMKKVKNKEDGVRLMGFGHRVYKNYDPRAKIIKKTAEDILGKMGGNDELLEIAQRLEEKALADDYFVERKLYPNVDFYTGVIYKAMGFPEKMFTVLFALGRLPGWIAQWRELMEDPATKIGRPRQIYVGEQLRQYPQR